MQWEYHKKLTAKIVAMTLCFSLIPLFTLGATIYFQFRDAYTNKTVDRIRTMAENRRAAIELFLEERTAQRAILSYRILDLRNRLDRNPDRSPRYPAT